MADYPEHLVSNWDTLLKAYIDAIGGAGVTALAQVTGVQTALGQVTVNVGTYATANQLNGTTDAGPAFTSAINAVSAAGGGRIITPPGAVFWWSGATNAELKSNIEIDLRGCVMKKTDGAGSYSMFVAKSHGATGYGSGPRNVTIRNGYFQGDFNNGGSLNVIAANHASQFLIESCEFVACQIGGHTFELDGCDNFTFRNCIWRGYKVPSGDIPRGECINTDISRTLAGAGDDPGSFDGLLTKNVTVDNCKFLPWTDPSTSTVYPAPVPLGGHSQREGKYYEGIFISNVEVVDPPKDAANTGVAGDDLYIRGLFHFPCVKDFHMSGVRVTATDGLGSIRVVMLTGRVSGDLASGDPNTSTATGTWAAPQGCQDIYIDDLRVKGFAGTVSTLNPVVFISGSTGANAKNIRVSMALDGGYKEALYLWRCEDATVHFNQCKDSETGARIINCQRVQVSGRMQNINLCVRLDGTTMANVGPMTAIGTARPSLVSITNSANQVTVANVNATGYTNLYSATSAVLTSHEESAVLGFTNITTPP